MADFSMVDHEGREEKIRQLAFRLWQDDGGSGGLDKEYWFRAVTIVDDQLAEQKPGQDKGQVEPEQAMLTSQNQEKDAKPAPDGGERRRYPGSGLV